jgi:predicted deacylase
MSRDQSSDTLKGTFDMELLGTRIRNGIRTVLEMEIASLYTRTRISIPVIVHKSKIDGPTLLVLSGIHGDEVNGVEINRRILHERLLKPNKGAVIHMPIANVMAFINMDRKFADGRDLNRSFPGSPKGSLASQLANLISTKIVPFADAVVDLHTGAEDRFNIAQIRYDRIHEKSKELAAAFRAPFTFLQGKPPTGSFRKLLGSRGIPNIIFEGGRSRSIDKTIVNQGIEGVLSVAATLGLIEPFENKVNRAVSKQLATSHWLRASSSGMLEMIVENGTYVERGDVIGFINGPYAQFQKRVRARRPGYIICVNESPVVHIGDAVCHVGEV